MGSLKGLTRSDVYLTDYVSKKHWKCSSTNDFSKLGITSSSYTSGSSEYGSFDQSFYRTVQNNGSVSGSYDLSLQTTITVAGSRQLPANLTVYSIPRDCFGDHIVEGSVELRVGTTRYFDREGIILDNNNNILGDIIYTKGLLLLRGSNITISSLTWTSYKPIFTCNVNCRVRDTNFNFTYNPTARNLELDDTVEFYPYITTVGLYNTANELIAVAKLNKPIRKCSDIDMTFKVSLDLS